MARYFIRLTEQGTSRSHNPDVILSVRLPAGCLAKGLQCGLHTLEVIAADRRRAECRHSRANSFHKPINH